MRRWVLITSLLHQSYQSIVVDQAKFTSAIDLCIFQTKNVQQSDEYWLKFATVWLPRCGTSFESTGVVLIDGHTSHVRRIFIELAAKQGIYVVVEPRHNSMLLQIAGVGVNRFLKKKYGREYTASKCAANVGATCFDDVKRFPYVLRTVKDI